ncbi:DUF4367 domain-containing protein [Diplocloster agilis]|uniref:DUF4367 domain-containing protein n=1 Tax=Diplocloster agilis TaxID=2850323 RepID=UPI000822711B|nr:DUF4367 domain-containing protein [Suonthocola fibrivorans]MCU6736770.1 DUF4367 domain-containing protein [Suonthocola fibrivorans]SCJ93515.1 Uncharacterised protein [uncultured Clostridium sp.]
MRLEDMKQEFPNMPEDMKAMVEREVAKQIKTVKPHFSAAKIAIASAVAVMVMGTTVFAGVKLYQMNREPAGTYAVETKIQKTEGAEAGTQTQSVPAEIPAVTLETGYIPEGMIQTEEGKYSYSDTPSIGGISIVLYGMDQGDDAFRVLDKGVLNSENILAGGHEGVYLEMQKGNDGSVYFNQRIYLSFPEVHHVVQMYVGEDVTREEALKTAEGIRLTPAENEKDSTPALAWSDYAASVIENEELSESDESGMCLTVPKERMENVHKIGDAFSPLDTELAAGLKIKVTDVQIADDVSLLNPAYMDSEFDGAVDAGGKLLPNTINYIKTGNGVDSLDEIIKTREVPQKLVYATVEYQNTGNTELNDVLYFGSLMKIQENTDNFAIYQGETPQPGDQWNVSQGTSLLQNRDMLYSDVLGGSENKNYISSIKPGETATVHMAYVVNEDELNKLYLNLDTYGGSFEFSDTCLDMGLVDIRQ